MASLIISTIEKGKGKKKGLLRFKPVKSKHRPKEIKPKKVLL